MFRWEAGPGYQGTLKVFLHGCKTETKMHLMPFDDVFQFSKQLRLYVRTQVDDRSCQAVVLK